MGRPSVCGLVLALLLAIPGAAPQGRERLIDGVAAQVGNSMVLHSEVMELSGPIETRMREAGRPDAEILRIRADALERLIEARLMEEVVRRLELGVSEAEVSQAIESIARDNGLSVQQLAQSVTSHGLTLEEYRGKIRKEIERSKVLNALVRSQVSVEDDEVLALYEQRYGTQRSGGEEIHVRHLVVMYGADFHRDMGTACKIAEDARQRIAGGSASFPQMAREYSDSNPQRGGELGWMHADDVAGWMAPVVAELAPGQVSGVIETRFGCNLLQLVDRRGFEAVTLEQAQESITNEIMMQKTEAEYVKWVDKLRAQTYIERKGIFAETSRLQGFGSPAGR